MAANKSLKENTVPHLHNYLKLEALNTESVHGQDTIGALQVQLPPLEKRKASKDQNVVKFFLHLHRQISAFWVATSTSVNLQVENVWFLKMLLLKQSISCKFISILSARSKHALIYAKHFLQGATRLQIGYTHTFLLQVIYMHCFGRDT